MLPLDPAQVDLWFTFYDDIRDERLLRDYRRLLTQDELAQEKRFHFGKDQHRYLVTRALVRTVLSRYAPVAAADWVFSKSAHGRPQIANDADSARRISFNISHTLGLIVLAVTSGRQALGVDTENLRRRQISIDVADRFFSAAEVSALHAVPSAAQHERFFHYWTLKESYIKARGLGLSIPLDQFGFHFPGEALVDIRIDARLGDAASRWRFWQLRPAPDYLAALCVERTQPEAPRLVTHRIVPLSQQAPLECALLSASA